MTKVLGKNELAVYGCFRNTQTGEIRTNLKFKDPANPDVYIERWIRGEVNATVEGKRLYINGDDPAKADFKPYWEIDGWDVGPNFDRLDQEVDRGEFAACYGIEHDEGYFTCYVE